MNLSRRLFLSGIAAGAGRLAAAPAASIAGRTPKLKFGIVSDTHVHENGIGVEHLDRVLEFFRDSDVDAVLNAGDITEIGSFKELRLVMDSWGKAFPEGKGRDGRDVVPFFVFGNHDYKDASYMRGKPLSESEKREAVLFNRNDAWKMITGSPFPGEVFSRKIKGYTFIGAHWKHEDEIPEWFSAHAADLDPARPVFYVQHPHPRGTCLGPNEPGRAGPGRDTLMRHPNIFCMAGHSHISNSDDMAIWLGGFASMASSAGIGAGIRRNSSYENGRVGKSMDGTPPPVRHMQIASNGKAYQASVVTVYDDEIIVSRRDVAHGESLGDWVIPFPFMHDAAHPYPFAERAAAPEFPDGAKLKITLAEGKTRGPNSVKEMQVKAVAPSAVGNGPHARAIDYKFEVADAATGAVAISRKTLQEGYPLAEARTLRSFSARCVFAAPLLDAPFREIFDCRRT